MSSWERTNHAPFSSDDEFRVLSAARKNRNSKRGMWLGTAGEVLMKLFQEGIVDVDIFLDPHFLVLPKNPMLFLPPVAQDPGTIRMYSTPLAEG